MLSGLLRWSKVRWEWFSGRRGGEGNKIAELQGPHFEDFTHFPHPKYDPDAFGQDGIIRNDWFEWEKITNERRKILLESFRLRIEARKTWIEHCKMANEGTHTSIKATIEYGKQAISLAFLLNGAAAVALITKGSPQTSANNFYPLVDALWLFALGCGSAAGCAALSYLAQGLFTKDRNIAGYTIQSLAIAAWFVSVGLFLGGAYQASVSPGRTLPNIVVVTPPPTPSPHTSAPPAPASPSPPPSPPQ